MLINYKEKQIVTRNNWQDQLAALEIKAGEAVEMIAKLIVEQGEALVSVYQFKAPSGDLGSIVVCHDLGRSALIFGTNIRWGNWDETFETLTLDDSGEKINFDGKPVYEGDEGSCSLGNF
jgi:hypothetical protein